MKFSTEYFIELNKPNKLIWEDKEPRQFFKRKNKREDGLSYKKDSRT